MVRIQLHTCLTQSSPFRLQAIEATKASNYIIASVYEHAEINKINDCICARNWKKKKDRQLIGVPSKPSLSLCSTCFEQLELLTAMRAYHQETFFGLLAAIFAIAFSANTQGESFKMRVDRFWLCFIRKLIGIQLN